jgi:hypothetical protein
MIFGLAALLMSGTEMINFASWQTPENPRFYIELIVSWNGLYITLVDLIRFVTGGAGGGVGQLGV